MKKNYLNFTLFFIGILSFSSPDLALDIHIPYASPSDLGNANAGWAASANNANTTYTNSAGLVRMTRPQLSIAPLQLYATTKFTGTATPPAPPFPPQQGSAGDNAIKAPLVSIYYATPLCLPSSLCNKIYFGFSFNQPFGLGPYFGKTSIIRYEVTRARLAVVDLSPSLGIRLTNTLSAGLGIDFGHLDLTVNNMFGFPLSVPDTDGQNFVSGWGYGAHAGVLYQFSPTTRIGLSSNSQIMIHAHGESKVFGMMGRIKTTNQKIDVALPAFTQLSFYHEFCRRFTILAGVFFNNYRSLPQVTLKNTMLPNGSIVSVSLPLRYTSVLDYALGFNYKATDKWLLRTGIQYSNAPSNNRYRLIADPTIAAWVLAAGVGYQLNPCIGFDVGYAHYFFKQARIDLTRQTTSSNGHSHTTIDVLGGQINWNI